MFNRLKEISITYFSRSETWYLSEQSSCSCKFRGNQIILIRVIENSVNEMEFGQVRGKF